MPNRLREFRRRAGLTQLQLAEKAGVDPRTILAAEKDRRPLRRTTMLRILRGLGMTYAQRGEVWSC